MKSFYTRLFWLLLVVSFMFRVFRLGLPKTYIFDEVYHVPSIRAISQGSPDAYDPYAQAPEPNTAYDWLHPPLAKLIQAGSVKIFGDNSFGWRLPSAIFGTLSIAAVYFLALTVTKKQQIALLAAALLSLENLHLTMSRIAMNDIFVTTWILLALTFFFKSLQGVSLKNFKETPYWKNIFLTGIFTGLALATKHSAIFLFPIYAISLLKYPKKLPLIIYLFLIAAVIYFLSYSQMFLAGRSLKDFVDLHKQIYWYQTNLSATHDYQSAAYTWPLMLRPVWFHVEYLQDKIGHIYNLGNPAIFWGGLVAVVLQGWTLKAFLLISYLALFVPLAFSPRIMFLHHYLPALAVLTVILAQVLSQTKNKLLITSYLLLVTLVFLFFYPLNTAIPIPENIINFWFWLPSWR